MATAKLINGTELEDGSTVFAIETWPFDEGPFSGPGDRSWANFVVTEDGAEFAWKTPADGIRAIAQRVAAGALAVEDAMRGYETREWVSRCASLFIDEFEREEPGLADLPDAEFARRMLLLVGQDLTNEGGGFGWYAEDDDACASDAAYALDLPSWAETETFEDGAPGSGYTGECIVLAPGKTLDDLAEWLEARAAGTKEPA